MYFLGDFFLVKFFLSQKSNTLTHSNAGRIGDDFFISIMSSSSSCKRAVARPRAFSKSVDTTVTLRDSLSSLNSLKFKLILFKPQHPELMWFGPPFLCQPRCTWVNALPGSTRRIFLMKNKNIFILKIFPFLKISFSQK